LAGGVCLIVTSLLLSFAYYFRTRPFLEGIRKNPGHDITWLDALVIGVAQAVAVLPGLSRSGSTIATGILLGDDRSKVASFSFFMVIIPILGEALLEVKDMLGSEVASVSSGALELTVGFIAAFVVGCIACKWMINLVKKGKLIWFALYCAVVGIICIVW
ncbi:MAG: undecaprenyl-diphosphate phosphatase, partial [Muribaculum sp.]|nr:undecaprenyl-diphosphate phosphatase [Muribaculum sp.]